MSATDIPAGIDLSQSRKSTILGCIIGTYSTALICIGLRFASRHVARAKLWWDDWMICAAAVFSSVVAFVGAVWMMPNGLGKHVYASDNIEVSLLVFFKGLLIQEICYTSVLVSAKFSVLLFYWRIFSVSSIRLPIIILASIVGSWGIAIILVSTFTCVPPAKQWDMSLHGSCNVHQKQFFIGNAVPNVFADIALLILPLPYIYGLKLARFQKTGLLLIFLVGIFVAGVSITRFTRILKLDLTSIDITWNFVDGEVWSVLEGNIAIICACLPSLGPLVSFLRKGSRKKKPTSGTTSSNSRFVSAFNSAKKKLTLSNIDTTTTSSIDNHLFERLPELENPKGVRTDETIIEIERVPEVPESGVELSNIPPRKGIRVQNDVKVDWQRAESRG